MSLTLLDKPGNFKKTLFNRVSSIYFPLQSRQDLYIPFTEEQKIFTRIIIVALYMIFIWGTVALGVRFSNLSNKGIIDRGPYVAFGF